MIIFLSQIDSFRVALHKQSKFRTSTDCRSTSIPCRHDSTAPDNVPPLRSRIGNCSVAKPEKLEEINKKGKMAIHFRQVTIGKFKYNKTLAHATRVDCLDSHSVIDTRKFVARR